jgi:hypothetical protein
VKVLQSATVTPTPSTMEQAPHPPSDGPFRILLEAAARRDYVTLTLVIMEQCKGFSAEELCGFQSFVKKLDE